VLIAPFVRAALMLKERFERRSAPAALPMPDQEQVFIERA